MYSFACREAGGDCKCVVLFSDDAQKFLRLKSLNEEQQLLASKQQSLMQQLDSAKDSAASAQETYRNACKAIEKRQNEVMIAFCIIIQETSFLTVSLTVNFILRARTYLIRPLVNFDTGHTHAFSMEISRPLIFHSNW